MRTQASKTHWLLLAAVIVLAALSCSARAADYDALFRAHGEAQGVDWRLLKAIAQVESSLDPAAEHPLGLSSGLMQVMCAPAHAQRCRNRFDIDGWPVTRAQLHDPDINVHLASQILAWNLRTYGLLQGIAVYNSRSARGAPRSGPFPNQPYVDKVLRRYRALEGEA